MKKSRKKATKAKQRGSGITQVSIGDQKDVGNLIRPQLERGTQLDPRSVEVVIGVIQKMLPQITNTVTQGFDIQSIFGSAVVGAMGSSCNDGHACVQCQTQNDCDVEGCNKQACLSHTCTENDCGTQSCPKQHCGTHGKIDVEDFFQSEQWENTLNELQNLTSQEQLTSPISIFLEPRSY